MGDRAGPNPNLFKNSTSLRPKFENPVPLPAISDFQLDNILARVVSEESAAVSQALLMVKDNYQRDLRDEIRKRLAVEQKIQYKNINVIKQTHELKKHWHSRKRALARATRGNDGSKRQLKNSNSLATEVDSLLKSSVDVSSMLQGLMLRLSHLDKKRGGTGVPDEEKYPNLFKLLSVNGGSQDECNLPSTLSDPSGKKLTSASSPPESGNGFQAPYEMSAVQQNETHEQHRSNEAQESPDQKFESEAESSMHVPDLKSVQETESDMAPEDFELFMDVNIAKYRLKWKKRTDVDFSELEAREREALHQARSSHNPLRLLSHNTGNHLDQPLKSESVAEPVDPFKYTILPKKSNATVWETPESSIHKKLRIKAMPPRAKTSVQKCDCSNTTSDVPGNSTVVSGQASKSQANQGISDDELWSSSELYTETEDVVSSDGGSSSSSDWFDGAIGDTNNYYVALKKKIKNKKSRKAKAQPLRSWKETSPNPKHSPSHRKLQPQRSILKLSKPRGAMETNSKSPEVTAKSPTPSLSSQNSGLVNQSYMASPRGSFINNESAVGYILRSNGTTRATAGSIGQEFEDWDIDGHTDDDINADDDVETDSAAEADYTDNDGRDRASEADNRATRDKSHVVGQLKRLLK